MSSRSSRKPTRVAATHPVLSPKYAPFGSYVNVEQRLRHGDWKARDVLNFTVKAFWRRKDIDLSAGQRAARDDFIDTYHKQVQKFDSRKADEDPVEPTDDASLTKYKEQLDKYFFFSTMPDYHLAVQAYTITDDNEPCPRESWKDDLLIVPVGNTSTVFDLHEVLAILVHEMTHLYLKRTTCTCDDCARNQVNGTGIPGDCHGPIFQCLHRLIITEMRKWHDHFANFDSKDCPDNSVSQYSLKSHNQACTREKKKGYNYDSKLIRKHYISLRDRRGNIIVKVRDVLRDNQKAAERKLWKEYQRQQRLTAPGSGSELSASSSDDGRDTDDSDDGERRKGKGRATDRSQNKRGKRARFGSESGGRPRKRTTKDMNQEDEDAGNDSNHDDSNNDNTGESSKSAKDDN
ncbi:hypothetical protein SCUP515_11647 [Seiridium cupressi]